MSASETFYVGKFTGELVTVTGKDQIEVYKVPITHTDKFPNDLPRYKASNPSRAPFKKLFEFPITDVVHSTHIEEKRAICQEQDGNARFKANQKLAKSTSCKLYYAEEQWNEQPIEEGDELLPGKYVWFSMNPSLPDDPEFKHEDYNVCYVKADSIYQYGPWSFTFDYSQLISAYKEHIENHSDPDKRDASVVLRNGGTLMYQREICYVVIVTYSKDTLHDDDYPIIQQYQDILPILGFRPRYIPPPSELQKWHGYDWDQLTHYDAIAFAVNCDWEGECYAKEEPREEMESGKVLIKKSAPIFKIPLPPGEPHCYFEDCEDDAETSYDKFHHFCLKYACNIPQNSWRRRRHSLGVPSCYSNEHTQWFKTEMPKKMEEMVKNMKEIANEMKVINVVSHIAAVTQLGDIADIADRTTEMATIFCRMVQRGIEMEGSEEANIMKIQEMIEKLKVKMEDMTNSAEVAMKATEMAQMAEDIAAMPGHTDDENELAEMARKIARQKMYEAVDMFTKVQEIPSQLAEKMQEMVLKSVVMFKIWEINRMAKRMAQSENTEDAVGMISEIQKCADQLGKDLKMISNELEAPKQ